MSTTIETLNWNDTFLNIDHLKASFPGYEFEVTTEDVSKHVPPFRYVVVDQ
jgi:intron-binding protein aquarius